MKLSLPVFQLKRRARDMARKEKIPLHEALDRIAQQEGFVAWSLLASQLAANPVSKTLLSGLTEGDLLLLGARPGHGKTMVALRLLLDAVREGRKAVLFTLDFTDREAREQIRALETEGDEGDKVEIVTSDEISADFIARHLSGSPHGTVAVIDYLQLLDQKRSKPALGEQLLTLRAFARQSGTVLGFIAQIDRGFDPSARCVPDMRDIRLPNPIDPTIFSRACFVHDGKTRFERVA